MDENYKYYKEHGICPQCCVREHAPGRVRCEICLAQNADSSARKRLNENDNEYDTRMKKMRYYNRSTRSERKENGKCIWCGKPLSAYSSCFCPDCRVKNQKKNERRKNGIPRSEWPSYGICYRCGKNPIVEGRKLCKECAEENIKNLKKANDSEKTKRQREYIKKQNSLAFMR